MKIAIATVQVPFVTGGAEILVSDLRTELRKRGHKAEIVTLPFKHYPSEPLLNAMIMSRMIDLTEVNGENIDLVIAMKFPMYYLKHPNKVIWLIHQHREVYDLWKSEYSGVHLWTDGTFIRNSIIDNDTRYIAEAKRIFTIAENVTQRLKSYNNIDAKTLYPPPQNYEQFYCSAYDDFIFYISRITDVKRQWLLVEAARFLKSKTQIVIAGKADNQESEERLTSFISKHSLHDRVKLLGNISDKEKFDYYSRCLGVYFGTHNEDYGYVTLEAFLSQKPVIIHKDAGGPLEFVEHGKNGYILDVDPRSVAATIDEWAWNKALAERMGRDGYQSLRNKGITWDFIIDSLLGV